MERVRTTPPNLYIIISHHRDDDRAAAVQQLLVAFLYHNTIYTHINNETTDEPDAQAKEEAEIVSPHFK